ncbi:hypothetical protein [Frigoribacterium sp. Leaf263]|uniref:hypothetical protein n=1 Tax=Frigoribacterium sp. Leaf263 TaxID=1736313 RepID=UPI0012E21341|nr:hypothetical protein [Frigoribacterium sp. Leaf263]
MSPRSSQQIYLLCTVGIAAGILLLVFLDGAAITLAGLPLGLSLGIALRTWWKKHGWNPGITITEDVAEGEAPRDEDHSADGTSRKPRGR